jgi:endogenous inhibitor of DNA gyrase (YacG/DUF329 family)
MPAEKKPPPSRDPAATPSRYVACPQCGVQVAWVTANRYRPFCSERCRQIDLGAWAAGDYRVPVVEEPEDPDQEP